MKLAIALLWFGSAVFNFLFMMGNLSDKDWFFLVNLGMAFVSTVIGLAIANSIEKEER